MAPSKIRKWYPYYIAGYDNDGVPIYVIEYGHWKYAEALRSGTGKNDVGDTKDLTWRYFQQGVYRLLRDSKKNNEQGVIAIFDYDGFSPSNFLYPAAIQMALHEMAMLDKVCNVINRAYLINSKCCSCK